MPLILFGELPEALGGDKGIVTRVLERFGADDPVCVERCFSMPGLKRIGDFLEAAAPARQRPIQGSNVERAPARANVEQGRVRVEALDRNGVP